MASVHVTTTPQNGARLDFAPHCIQPSLRALVVHRPFLWAKVIRALAVSAEEDVFHQPGDDQHEYDQDNEPTDPHTPGRPPPPPTFRTPSSFRQLQS